MLRRLPFGSLLFFCQCCRHDDWRRGFSGIDLTLFGLAGGIILGESLGLHLVILVEAIVLDELDQLRRVGRVGGVTGFFQAVSPSFIVRYIIIEQGLISIPVT